MHNRQRLSQFSFLSLRWEKHPRVETLKNNKITSKLTRRYAFIPFYLHFWTKLAILTSEQALGQFCSKYVIKPLTPILQAFAESAKIWNNIKRLQKIIEILVKKSSYITYELTRTTYQEETHDTTWKKPVKKWRPNQITQLAADSTFSCTRWCNIDARYTITFEENLLKDDEIGKFKIFFLRKWSYPTQCIRTLCESMDCTQKFCSWRMKMLGNVGILAFYGKYQDQYTSLGLEKFKCTSVRVRRYEWRTFSTKVI